MIKFGLVLATMLFVAIGVQAKHHKKSKKQPIGKGIVSAMVQYTGCYGRCKEYSIELDNSGTVTYTGIRNADDSGSYKKKIDLAEAKRILQLFVTYKVDTCPNRFPNRIPDIQTMFFNIKYADSTKRINNATFGPSYFKELAAELEQYGKKSNDGWQKVSNTKK